MKDHNKKFEFNKKYKNHRNLFALIKQNKIKYFNKYFEDNWNNTNNTWKGIKNIIITLNNVSSDVPRTLSVNDVTASNPCDIANTINNYFTSVAKKKQI